ncbi:MAG: hypothetical protein KGH52_02835 [Candidatus Micrarchaeota archaeon]|nr:hypothetical protein [Candidatus Micrarchaeota archaeon]
MLGFSGILDETMSSTIKKQIMQCASLAELQGLGTDVMCARIGGREFHRHINASGSVGGFVESTARAMDRAYIGPNAIVAERALVSDAAGVYDLAIASGDCWVRDNARVFGKAAVYGYAHVYGEARVYDGARVFGEAEVFENAKIFELSLVFERAHIHGSAEVGGTSWACGDACIRGDARLYNQRVWKRIVFETQWQLNSFFEEIEIRKEFVDQLLKRS